MPKLFATLWELLSVESGEEVSQHAQFLQADLDQDPNVLWIIIRGTHLTAIHAVRWAWSTGVSTDEKQVCPTSTEARIIDWRI